MRLKTVMRTSPWNAALKDGRVTPRGYELEFEEVQPITRAFRVMCRELAYDVTEMAATTYLVARDHGKPWTAPPGPLAVGPALSWTRMRMREMRGARKDPWWQPWFVVGDPATRLRAAR